MRRPADRRAELYAEGLKRIASSGENDYRRFLLVECLEAYAELDDGQNERLQALLQTDPYQEVESLMKTTYERGIEQGIERGIERGIEQGIERGIEQGIERGIEQGERRLTLRLMQAKFGPLSPKVKQQVEALSPEALTQLQLDLLNAQAIGELGLGD
jgi:flagellar biosynthesis/type III secretory pathway protein FliH